MILDPEWVRVLKDDSVTLRCQATYSPGDNSTKWFHNGSLIPHQHATYVIGTVRVEDSGEYKCQTALSVLSDPVNLEVHVGELRGKKGPESLGESPAVGLIRKRGDMCPIRWEQNYGYRCK